MLNISYPMTGIMAIDICSWLRWAERADTDVPRGMGANTGVLSSLASLFISAGSLDSSGTERDEMDTWFNESLIKVLGAFLNFSFPFAFRMHVILFVVLCGPCQWSLKKIYGKPPLSICAW